MYGKEEEEKPRSELYKGEGRRTAETKMSNGSGSSSGSGGGSFAGLSTPPAILPDHPLLPDFLPDHVALLCLLRLPSHSIPSLRLVSSAWHSTLSHPSFPLLRRRLHLLRPFVCFLHPSSSPPSSPREHHHKSPSYSISLFDPSDSSSTILPPIPHFAHHGLPLFCQCVSAGPFLLVLGGWDPVSWSVLTSLYIYSFAHASWRRGADMPSPRSFFAAASCGDADSSPSVLVAGGHDNDKNALRSAHLYDLRTDTWRALPDMAHHRDECVAATISGGKVAVISGFSTESQGMFRPSAEIYDPDADKWELLPEMWPAGRSPASVMTANGELYAIIDGNLAAFRAPEKKAANEKEGGMEGWGWKKVVQIPAETKAATAAAWVGGNDVVVTGYTGEEERPYEAFMGKLKEKLGKGGRWRRVEESGAGSCLCGGGCVQKACTVEL